MARHRYDGAGMTPSYDREHCAFLDRDRCLSCEMSPSPCRTAEVCLGSMVDDPWCYRCHQDRHRRERQQHPADPRIRHRCHLLGLPCPASRSLEPDSRRDRRDKHHHWGERHQDSLDRLLHLFHLLVLSVGSSLGWLAQGFQPPAKAIASAATGASAMAIRLKVVIWVSPPV
jgi:hypothetical protein